jgi:uncharacterized protein (DUF885 family)
LKKDNLFLDNSTIKKIQWAAKAIISKKVLPAFKKLRNYVKNEYMKHLRPGPGISAVPGGLDMYKGYLEYYTTLTGITPGKSKYRKY